MNPSALFQDIANTGVVGVMLVLALMVIIYLFQALMKEKDKAVEKQETTNIVLTSVNDTMRELLLQIEKEPYESNREKKIHKS